MASAKRRLIVSEDFDLGQGATTIPTDSGGTRAATKFGAQTILGDFFNVKEAFGATGDGATNDYAAVAAAIAAANTSNGGTVYFPNGTYLIGTALGTIPSNVTLLGNGNCSKIKKNFNGDLLTLGSGGHITKLYLDGNNSGGKTGRLVVISSGNDQVISESTLTNTDSYCLEVTTAEAGTQMVVGNCPLIGGRSSPYVAIKLPNDAGVASPRSFVNVNTGGAILVDFNGSNNTFVTNCRTNGFSWTGGASTSGNVTISNCRIGNTASMNISGASTMWSNCVFGDAVVFDANSIDCVMSGCIVPSWGITSNGSGNYFDIGYKEYTPTWNQSASTQPVLGDGTITGVYARKGRMMDVHIQLTSGSTTSYGNNTTGYQFSLPYPALNGLMAQIGTAFIVDASGITTTTHRVILGANQSLVTIDSMTGQLVRLGVPLTWATGDKIYVSVSYVAN